MSIRNASVLSVRARRPAGAADRPGRFYAAIANEGKRPTPHVIEQITQDGRNVYKADERLTPLAGVDPAAVFQLRSLLQGVVARGTAARLSSLSTFIGGRTGTSDDFNDAWFASFSNDVTVVVWVGYDNAKGKRTLGHGQAGSKVAIPIFEPIMRTAWATYAPQTPLPKPSPEAARHLIALPIDVNSGQRLDSRGGDTRFDIRGAGTSRVSGGFMEYFRLDESGRLNDTQERLTSRGFATADTTKTAATRSSAATRSNRGSDAQWHRPASASRARAAVLQRGAELSTPAGRGPPRADKPLQPSRPSRPLNALKSK